MARCLANVPIAYFSLRFYGSPIELAEGLDAVEPILHWMRSVRYIQIQWISEWRSAYWEVAFDSEGKERVLEDLSEEDGHNMRLHWLKAA
jgi:hypothetical protein